MSASRSFIQSRPSADDLRVFPDYHIHVDHVSASEWSTLLDAFTDANIYQTWAYGAVQWQEKSLSHVILKRGDKVVAIAQLRIVRPGNLPLGIAYLRWGPLCHRNGAGLDAEALYSMVNGLREEYVVRRRLLLEIIPNAFSGSLRAGVFEDGFRKFERGTGIVTKKYRTFVMDLSSSIENLRKQLDAKWRNKLSGAERNGLRIAHDDTPEAFSIFRKMYDEMVKRKRFRANVSIEDFGRMQAKLPGNQRLKVSICFRGADPVAGIVCSALGDSAIYLLGATSDAGLKMKGSYLLHWEMIKTLRENGVRYYDLGGIDPIKNPGVFTFKRGLSGADVHQIDSFVACENGLGGVLMKAGQYVRSLASTLSNG
jgi:hypothetical protein